MSKENVVTILFNEPVVFEDYSKFKQSLKANIVGPAAPYEFSYEIVTPSSSLPHGTKFTSMTVNIFDVKAPIYGRGSEKVELWFEDLTVIKDLVNNTLAEGKITGNLKKYEYISEGIFSHV